MALPILDGNQSATTLSSILTGGEHIPAHTVVSLGTQAITDMRGAVSGSVVSISNFPATQTIAGTVTANNNTIDNYFSSTLEEVGTQDAVFAVRVQGSSLSPLPISISNVEEGYDEAINQNVLAVHLKDFSGNVLGTSSMPLPISGTVTIGSALPAGTNRIGVVTIGAGTVTIGAGTAQIGSVTASISGTVPISISSVTVGNSVTIASLPAISGTVTVGNSVTIGSLPLIAGTVTANVFGKDANSPATAQIPVISYDEGIVGAGSSYVVPVQVTNLGGQISEANPLPISGTVTANTFALQGTAVTTSNFTSTTASTVLAGYNATREVLTIFNEGAGNLHICAGATCTTIAYQVRLSAGDYYEVPLNQTSLTHSAVFATAGTARVTQVS